MRAPSAFVVVVALFTTSAQAQEPRCDQSLKTSCFTGTFGLVDIPDNATEKRLADDFGFKDGIGVGWETRRGDITNGASIPRFFHPIIGDNWDERYIRAAVIHDRYCDVINSHNVRSWQTTHRMFYDALLASGVGRKRAALMYYAVYNFGPTWDTLSSGSRCRVTDRCIQVVRPGQTFVRYDDRYDDPGMASELEAVARELEAGGPAAGTPEDVLQISARRHPVEKLISPIDLETPGPTDR